MSVTPILLVGAGALGSSILKGFRRSGHIAPSDVMILDLKPQDEAQSYAADGANLNPPPELWAQAKTIIIAVKPQSWRDMAKMFDAKLNPEAVLISVMAGVRTQDLAEVLAPVSVARVMPTTGVATGKGVASIYASDPHALEAARFVFEPIAATAILSDEGLIDAATAVSGSGPAYVYAFARSLEKAALSVNLTPADARTLARATLISAARLLDETGEEPDDLIRKVASPGGTTEAGLRVLCADGGLDDLIKATVEAAFNRSRELG
ncbi:MAG: pyrroline-5-carboxylate reductase [Asticcacaulis sp. 32-58-5]|nr:MAG: pyrroline-5-carboxylate reductase [Asticcacaulis sp. 32-58-5]